MGFSHRVFKKKSRDEKTKGVDIALTNDMLNHALLGNYDGAFLVAGDGDYVPLVEEVKRLGRLVFCVFFKGEGLSPKLRRACDDFSDLTKEFADHWWKRR